MMPVISPSPPPPVAAVQEFQGGPVTIAGQMAVIVLTRAAGRYAAFHPDLGVVNISRLEYGTAIDAAMAPIPISTVVYIDEAMALGGDDDPMGFYHPLVGKGGLTVIAEKGDLPPFEWEF